MYDLHRRDFLRAAGTWAAAAYLLPPGAMGQTTTLTIPSSKAGLGLFPNREPLLPGRYIALPLGSVRAQGWLLKQLELQRDGLTGHAEELASWLPDLQNNAWTGGTGDNWERGPYYLKGLVTLAYGLDDANLKAKASRWIEAIFASQKPDGFFGPEKNKDWWPRMVVNYALRDYYEATADPRVIPFLQKYYGYLAQPASLEAALREYTLNWGKSRSADEMETILWLYNRTGDQELLSLATKIRDKSYNWPDLVAKDVLLGREILGHGVNVWQMFKRYSVNQSLGDTASQKQLLAALDSLEREHGSGLGITSGTEHLSGRSPSQAFETCAIVENMLSHQTNLQIFGAPHLGDEQERLAFNALPAALSDDIHQHVYYTRPNHPCAHQGGSGFWEDYGDGLVPSPKSGYPCCCYNFHMGWPKYVQNSWAATPDGGLASLVYAPSKVSARVSAGIPVTITQTTHYPFSDEIRFKIELGTQTQFPFEFRIPGWCKSPQVMVAGQKLDNVAPGTYARIDRSWSNGDEVIVKLPAEIQAREGYLGAVLVERGPLVFSLRIKADKKIVKAGDNGFDRYELAPTNPWNYALAVDPASPSDNISVRENPMPENPFIAETTPIQLDVKARRLPNWKMARNGMMADDPPLGPVTSDEPEEKVTLVPFGAQFLRMTWFPRLGTPPPLQTTFNDDFSKPDWFERWGVYGTGWYRENNTLACRPKKTAKIVALSTNLRDLVCDAQVWAPVNGDAGIMFRASRFGFEGNEFDGYYAGISAQANAVIIGKCNGAWNELKRAAFTLKADQPYAMRVQASGTKLQVYLSDMNQPILEVEDTDHSEGTIGLRLAHGPHASNYNNTRFGTITAHGLA